LGFPGADQVGRCARAQEQPNGLDDDGLSCTRLAGEYVEAGLELDLDGLNHRKVADTKQAQHVDGTSIVSYV
jgi:hypothetical protein